MKLMVSNVQNLIKHNLYYDTYIQYTEFQVLAMKSLKPVQAVHLKKPLEIVY